MEDTLSSEERQTLLVLAREAIQESLSGKPRLALDISTLPARLQEPGATFVTLTIKGDLRGCIGTLAARQSLAEDVREHAAAAATQDFRFPPLKLDELPLIKIEISRLTEPKDLDYQSPQDLVSRLRPNIDGVTLNDGFHRATFLPQVWSKLPDPEEFLDHLCQKMGVNADSWRTHPLKVQTYQVEEFQE